MGFVKKASIPASSHLSLKSSRTLAVNARMGILWTEVFLFSKD